MSIGDEPVEQASVQYGLTTIEYAIHRSPRRTTVSIAVDPEAAVIVTAPLGVAREQLARIVASKGHWIRRTLRQVSDRQPARNSKEFVSGEGFYYLGKQFQLKLETASVQPVKLDDKYLHVSIPMDLSKEHWKAYSRAALIDWYRARAGRLLPIRAKTWAKKLGLTLHTLSLSEPSTRWGSASKSGSIRINWRIIQAPGRLIDYVLVHELCHLEHSDHSREFWALLGRHMPDYEARKSALFELGALLQW